MIRHKPNTADTLGPLIITIVFALLALGAWREAFQEFEAMQDTTENRAALRLEIRTQREALTRLADMLEGVDHAAARDIETARSALFAAWSKLRSAPPEHAVCPMIRQALGGGQAVTLDEMIAAEKAAVDSLAIYGIDARKRKRLYWKMREFSARTARLPFPNHVKFDDQCRQTLRLRAMDLAGLTNPTMHYQPPEARR